MTRARILADYVSSGDELALKAPIAGPTFTGTVAIPNVANLETAVVANTAKVTNATHTGDVTGGTALTIATDAVDIAMLSATGTASATTFLRGDNAWEAAGGGKVVSVQYSGVKTSLSRSTSDRTDLNSHDFTITAGNKCLILFRTTVHRHSGTTVGYCHVYAHATEGTALLIGKAIGYLQPTGDSTYHYLSQSMLTGAITGTTCTTHFQIDVVYSEAPGSGFGLQYTDYVCIELLP